MPNHNKTYGWGGPKLKALRRMFARKLEEAEARGQPLLCKFCGKPVLNSQPWQIDHALSIAEGGSLWDVGNMAPAHSDCNSADGARISNSRQGRMRKWD